MYRSHNNDRGRRDNGRRGSSYENDYSNRNRNDYSDAWRRDNDRYEDGRYHSSNYRRRQEDDYGPFSHIYSDEQTGNRRDFDTRYNNTNNYYYGNGPVNDRSDEARGMSFGDLFNGRKRNQSDRDYFYNSGYHRDDDRRYDNERNDDRYSDYNSSHRNYDDRNVFERVGDRIKDTWNEWRNDNNRNSRREEDENRNDYGRNYQERDRSYNGYSTDYKKRRRSEGYNY